MSAPIGTIPRGLLDLLSLKQMGRNPSQLADVVDPQVDMRDFWFNQIEQDQVALFGGQPTTAALASAAVGLANLTVGGVNAQVPNNEVWYVRTASLFLGQTTFAAAGDTIRAGLLATSGLNAGGLITPATADQVTARVRLWTTEPMPQPLWLLPSTTFFACVLDIGLAAGTRTLVMNMRAVRMRI